MVIVIFRTMRALKLIWKWEYLGRTLNFLWSARSDILNFTIVVIIFVFMFALIGMELFANEIKFSDEDLKDLNGHTPRVVDFDDLAHALLSAFSIQNGDSWSTYYILYLRYKPFEATVYFISAVIILNILLIGLLLGILLQNFFADEQKSQIEQEEKMNEKLAEQELRTRKTRVYKNKIRTLLTALKFFKAILSHPRAKSWSKVSFEEQYELKGKSLNIFPPDSYVRNFIYKVVSHWTFKLLIYIMIAVNSLVIGLYTPLIDPDSVIHEVAYVIDWIATIFFSVEIVLKFIAYGLVNNGEKSFFKVPLNIIDLIATIAEIITLVSNLKGGAFIKVLSLFRILRAIRFIVMNKTLKTRAKALVSGMPEITHILLIVVFFIEFFALIGIQFFKGMYYYCDSSMSEAEDEIITIYDCMNVGSEWRSRDIGFDNIFYATMTLFELFTGESWCYTLTFTPDFVGIDYEPKRDVNLKYIWFGLIFTILGFILIRGMFTGVVSNAFFAANEKLQGLDKLSNVQRRWVSLSKVIFKASPIKEVTVLPNCNSTSQIADTIFYIEFCLIQYIKTQCLRYLYRILSFCA